MSDGAEGLKPGRRPATSAPLALLDGVPLTGVEAGYVEAARTANTLRGYRLDWREFTAWCAGHSGLAPLPVESATVTGYLTALADLGAKVGMMSRRLSTIEFAHQLRDLPDQTRNARAVTVWKGRRCTHEAPLWGNRRSDHAAISGSSRAQ